MVAAGELGEIRVVQVEYPQDWLATALEETGQKQADWRTDPAQLGRRRLDRRHRHPRLQSRRASSPGSKLEALAADLTTFVAGPPARRQRPRAAALRKGGARGMLWASQVAPGNENGLQLRVYGEKGGLEWAQEDPNYLLVRAVRRAAAADHPRRRRGRCRRRRASPACRPAIRRAISRASPTSMPRSREPSARRAPGQARCRGPLPDRRRRSARRGIRRRRRGVVATRGQVGEGEITAPSRLAHRYSLSFQELTPVHPHLLCSARQGPCHV